MVADLDQVTEYYESNNHQQIRNVYIILKIKTSYVSSLLGHLQGEQFRYTRAALI
jgi:hypothetical protein